MIVRKYVIHYEFHSQRSNWLCFSFHSWDNCVPRAINTINKKKNSQKKIKFQSKCRWVLPNYKYLNGNSEKYWSLPVYFIYILIRWINWFTILYLKGIHWSQNFYCGWIQSSSHALNWIFFFFSLFLLLLFWFGLVCIFNVFYHKYILKTNTTLMIIIVVTPASFFRLSIWVVERL